MRKFGVLLAGVLLLSLSGCGSAPLAPAPEQLAAFEASKAKKAPPKLKPTKAKKAVDWAILRAATGKDPLSYATLYGLKFEATDNAVVYTFKLKAIVKTRKEVLTYPEVTGLYSTKTDSVPKLTLGKVVKKPRSR